MDVTQENEISIRDLPMTFNVKYLGCEQARGLWGIKNTRRPVDHLVTIAKTLPPNKVLPLCRMTISSNGVSIEITNRIDGCDTQKDAFHKIDTISYGVQDLVYTRVFAMIIVKNSTQTMNFNPFQVHAFVCDSRALARKITYALAASFQEYSKSIKEEELRKNNVDGTAKRIFAIDLRKSGETIEDQETEA